jgi:hypothetical protein
MVWLPALLIHPKQQRMHRLNHCSDNVGVAEQRSRSGLFLVALALLAAVGAAPAQGRKQHPPPQRRAKGGGGGTTVISAAAGGGGGVGGGGAAGGVAVQYGPTPGGVLSDDGEAVSPPNKGNQKDLAFAVRTKPAGTRMLSACVCVR